MDGNVKIERWTLEDGRRAEKRIVETVDGNGLAERVIELHIEDPKPLRLQSRVVEKIRPVIFERKVEKIDPSNGAVIEQMFETIEPRSSGSVADSIGPGGVSAQSFGDPSVKDEIVNAVVAALKRDHGCHKKHAARAEPKTVQSLGLAEEIEKLQKPQSDGMSIMDKALLVIIACQVLGLGYILFFM